MTMQFSIVLNDMMKSNVKCGATAMCHLKYILSDNEITMQVEPFYPQKRQPCITGLHTVLNRNVQFT